ncbi:unnamed protein product [marine sediment metagenome]|uniref:Beta-ketoacyl synthase-like N-terminal domain-containing protein n=1 Tax=marine sediment metagenome TaxID=412755 RepID=X0T9I2_9ZZZZ
MPENNTSVVVTGLGALTPVGNDVPITWTALVEGRSGIKWITRLDPSLFGTQIAGEVKGFEPKEHFGREEARRLDRFVEFAVVATRQALEDAKLTINADNAERVGVVIGTAVGGIETLSTEFEKLQARGPRRLSPFFLPMMMPDTASGQVAISCGAKGPIWPSSRPAPPARTPSAKQQR